MKTNNNLPFGKDGKPRMPGQIGETKVTMVEKSMTGVFMFGKRQMVNGSQMARVTF